MNLANHQQCTKLKSPILVATINYFYADLFISQTFLPQCHPSTLAKHYYPPSFPAI